MSGDEPLASTAWPFVWFFIPLPEAAGIPHGWHVEIVRTPSFKDLEELRAVAGLDVSLLIHQVDRSPQYLLLAVSDVFTLAKQAIGSHAQGQGRFNSASDDLTPPPDPTLRLTVAEVAVPLPRDGLGERSVGEAFERALHAVRAMQRAYAALVQRPLRLVTYRNLPSLVPMVTGRVHEGERRRPDFDELSSFLVSDSMFAQALPHPILNGDMLEALHTTMDSFGRGSPFGTYADLRREGWVQRDYEGNLYLAAITAGSAAEVLLDTLLVHMLWEEGSTPDDAAALFQKHRGFRGRLTSEFHPRLGGNWSPHGSGIIGQYLRYVVELRNRAVHAAHEPTSDEAHTAYRTLIELEHFIADRLASERGLTRYPRTAIAWMGENGLKGRGRWTSRLQTLTSDPNEPNWIDTFNRWRRFFDRALDPDAPAPGTSPEALELYVQVSPDGKVEWLLRDNATGHAVVLEPSHRFIGQNPAAPQMVAALVTQGVEEVTRGRIEFAPIPAPELDWQPEYLGFPELTIKLPTR